jgi:hypothetical protein
MNAPEPKRRRRWYQFSLRTLMLFMVVCAVASAWVGWKLEETRREQAVVAEIEKLEAIIWYRVSDGRLYQDSPRPEWIPRHFRRVRGVRYRGGVDIDAELVHLTELPKLNCLIFINTRITDAGLEHLKELTNLEFLDLRWSQVTAEGVQELQQALPNCDIAHGSLLRLPDISR